MPVKTYVPTLRFMVRNLNDYLSTHSATIQANVSTDVWTCISALATAVAQCAIALGNRAKE